MSWLPIIGSLLKPVDTWLKNRGERQKAKHKRDIAIIDNQARLAREIQSHNASWEMASLADKDISLRWVSFLMFTFPIILVVISPEHGKLVFERLKLVPEWMLYIWFLMISGVWGIARLKDAVPQLIAGMRGKK